MIKKIFPNISFLFVLISFCFGSFFIGRFTSSKPSEVITKTETVKSESKISEVGTQANVQKDSNKDKIQVDIKKNYSPNGKLISTEYQSFKLLDRTTNDISTTRLALQDIQNTKTTLTETKTFYQPNWLFGLSLPVSTVRDFKQFNLTQLDLNVDYRIFTRLHVFGSSNYNFTDTRLGFMTAF
jgi:hypothetical protein